MTNKGLAIQRVKVGPGIACDGRSRRLLGNSNARPSSPPKSVRFVAQKKVDAYTSQSLFAQLMRMKFEGQLKKGLTKEEMGMFDLKDTGKGHFEDITMTSPRFHLKGGGKTNSTKVKKGEKCAPRRIEGINDMDTKLRFSNLSAEKNGFVNLRDVVLHKVPGYNMGDGSEASSMSSDGYEALQEERIGKMLHLFHSIQLAEPDAPVEGSKRRKPVRQSAGKKRVPMVRPPEVEVPKPPKEAVICINSMTGEEQKKILGQRDSAEVEDLESKSQDVVPDETKLETVTPDVKLCDDLNDNVFERPDVGRYSPRPDGRKSMLFLNLPKDNGRPSSAPVSRPLKSALKCRRKSRVKSATYSDPLKMSAGDLKKILPRKSFFNSHDVALQAAGYDLGSFVKKTRPSVRFNENVEIESIPHDDELDTYRASEPEKDDPESTNTGPVNEPKEPEEKPPRLSIGVVAKLHILAQKSRKKKTSVADDSLKVDRKLLVEYLTRVKERPREFAQILKASREKSAKDAEFNSIVKFGSISRRSQQPQTSRRDTPIMQAVKGLVTRNFDPSHIRRTLGGGRMLRRRSSSLSVSSVASSTADSMHEVCKGIPPDASVLERSKLKIERWLHTVTTSQLEKAKDAAMQELGEVNHTRKWWELNRDCRYLRQPGTNLDPEPDFEDIMY